MDPSPIVKVEVSTVEMLQNTKTAPFQVSMAVEKGAKTAVAWLLFTLPLSLLEGGVLSERPAAVKGVARRSEPFTARTVLRSSTRGKGVALNGPLKWPSRSQPLTLDWARDHLSYTKSLPPVA